MVECLEFGIGLANKIMLGLVGCCALWLLQEFASLAALKKEQVRTEKMISLYAHAKMISDMVACRAAEFAVACDPECHIETACDYYFANMPKVMLMAIDAYEADGRLDEWVETLMAASVTTAVGRERRIPCNEV